MTAGLRLQLPAAPSSSQLPLRALKPHLCWLQQLRGENKGSLLSLSGRWSAAASSGRGLSGIPTSSPKTHRRPPCCCCKPLRLCGSRLPPGSCPFLTVCFEGPSLARSLSAAAALRSLNLPPEANPLACMRLPACSRIARQMLTLSASTRSSSRGGPAALTAFSEEVREDSSPQASLVSVESACTPAPILSTAGRSCKSTTKTAANEQRRAAKEAPPCRREFELPVPAGYDFSMAICSYGFFCMMPNQVRGPRDRVQTTQAPQIELHL